jgi:hypothetical protein
MAKVKDRQLRRPWGRKRGRYGWIIQPDDFLKSIKDADIVEMGSVRVGARTLGDIIKLMQFPNQELLISANGHLEFENIERYIKKVGKYRRTEFRKPRRIQSFRILSDAWIPRARRGKQQVTAVIKPKKYL